MALEEYRRKRDFTRTPEPVGEGEPARASAGQFLIQKHAARRLHYDFRLELDGVLKSWAVTRTPSLDPAIKRLAVETEDHPLDYGDFEGVIPAGQYGAGTVLLWDQGGWLPEGDPHAGLAAGVLKFRLDGQRLRGGFALVRLKDEGRKDGGGHHNWLLIKERDDDAGGDLADDDRSVASGRSMADIAAAPERVWTSAKSELHPDGLPGARAAELPARLSPMLATLAEEAPAGEAWLHEIKFDGYRLLARVEAGRCRLFTRSGLDWTERFPAIATACAALPCRAAWLDGEVVALDAHGVSRFHDLQRALADNRDEGLVYHLFDLVHLDGWDVAAVPLEARKDLLRRLLPAGAGPLRYTDHMEGRGPDFRRQACTFALEGIIAKRRDRPYRPERGKDWLKVKCTGRQEFVVAGYTHQTGRRSGISALLLGVYDHGRLIPAGRVGTGFSEREAAALEARLKGLARPGPPFAGPTPNIQALWVEPRLVVEVAFTEWTPDGALRHPTYQGLRLDREPAEVVREGTPGAIRGGATRGNDMDDRLAAVPLTNPERVLFPEQGLTKRALAAYYLQVAEGMLPHLRGRPLTLLRCPEGTAKACFFQRHPHPGMPKAIRRFPDGGEVLLAIDDKGGDDLEGLVGLVQMGALEIHAWGASTADIERPDRLVLDLDPDEGLAWSRVVEGALAVKARLDALGLTCFLKATGGKGLHVVTPLVPRAGWDDVKAFTKGLAEAMAAEQPERYTANMAKARRSGRIFIDYLRNQRGATAIAPFSTRARPGAPVAVPLAWSELAAGIRSDHFTVETVTRRLSALAADPWAGMADAARPLPALP